MNTLTIIALILIFLGGLGAILLTIGQSLSSADDKKDIMDTTKSENKILKDELSQIRKEWDELNKTLTLRDANIREQNKNIIELSTKLANQSKYIQDFVSGGDSYLFLDMRKLSPKGSITSFMFQLENHFDLPVYSIDCDIYNYELISPKFYRKNNNKELFIKIEDYKNAEVIQIKYPELRANGHYTIDRVFPVNDCLYYSYVRTRSKTVFIKMTILIVGQGDYFGFQVFDKNGQLLKEDINKEMPKEISNKIRSRLNSIPTNISLTIEN